MADSFFVAEGDRYLSTELTRGPWDPDSQHAGPPAALIGREVESLDPTGRHVGRITFEILRPVPIAPLRVHAEVVRPGRSVDCVEATLSDENGPVIRSRAWRLRIAEEAVFSPQRELDGLPGPERGRHFEFAPGQEAGGYHDAIDYRFLEGEFTKPGPAKAWMRVRVPLVAGEALSPLQRVLVVADTGNGISAVLDWRRYLFINVDLSVHLHRYPESEWVCLDSRTRAEPNGVGLADTLLWDERGPIGRGAQTLLVGPR